jgi:CheY-like chemotaxis protein
MHGGAVEAYSAGVQQGSQFVVRLPIAAPLEPAEEATRLPTREAATIPRMRVLIVDDNESAAYLLERLLHRLGQDVHAVNSAHAALEVLLRERPQVVISDIGMPEMSGYELAQAIRAQRGMHQPTLIALTGYGKDSDRLEAARSGFDYHLCKPVSLQALTQILGMLIPPKRSDNEPDR